MRFERTLRGLKGDFDGLVIQIVRNSSNALYYTRIEETGILRGPYGTLRDFKGL
jgi:hypothetical protein